MKNLWLYNATCFVLRLLLKATNRIQVVGLRNVPKTGGLLIASNHASYIDPPAIGSLCRTRAIHFMARDTLFRNRLLGWFFRRVGVVPLDRERGGDLKAMRTAIKLLHRGEALCLFPEGMRTPDGNLQRPRRGVGFLVAKSNVPVVPVYIHGSYEAWPKNSGRFKRVQVTVSFGKLITQTDIRNLGTGHEAYGKIGDLIMARIAEIKEKFDARDQDLVQPCNAGTQCLSTSRIPGGAG